MVQRLSILIGAVLTAHLFASSAMAQADRMIAPDFDGTDLVAPPTEDWPTNGGNWYNQRYSPLSQINRTNVATLKGVWRARLDGSGVDTKYSGEAQPIVYGGVAYIVTGADDVFAIDIESGERLWKYTANLDQSIDVVCCGWTSRGVGLGDGRVYVGQLDGKLVALDQRSGEVVWEVQAARWEEGFSITSAPLYYDGMVITGFSGGERGVRGQVKAFAADSGAPAWTFHTIPGPGELGHDTWPQDNDVWMHGGATVWNTPAIDPELGLLFFSTGNAAPDFNGGVRPGDNLFSASIVAIDIATGEYRWHFQQVHHDIWDLDGPSPVVLFDIELDGALRRGLAQPSKTGWVYILDRTNGEPLIGIDERPVPQDSRQATSATQPYPRGDSFVPQHIDIAPEGFRLINDGKIFTPFWTQPMVLKPSLLGGANWPPSSYDPATGYFYVCAADDISVFTAEEIDATPPPDGESYVAGSFGGTAMPAYGVFAAMDMRTNKIVWQQHWSDICYSGSTTTAGGLVFVGRNDGRLTALDASNGALLWEFQTGAGMNSTASIFEHKGKQFVIAYSAGNLFAGTAKGDSLWLFSLDGELEPAPEPNSIMLLSEVATGDPDLENGRIVYESACLFCHGEDATGGHGGGPTLTELSSLGASLLIVTEGRGDMPPFAGALTPEQIRDVTAFVLENFNE